MIRTVLFLAGAGIALASSFGIGDAARVSAHNRHHSSGSTRHQNTTRQVDWRQRDAASYVVSTLNMLRTPSGRSVARIAENRLDVEEYDVYADSSVPNLYFIELRRENGSIAGAFVYEMGWLKPQSVTSGFDALGVVPAPAKLVTAYKSDHQTLIGSFSSTMPV